MTTRLLAVLEQSMADFTEKNCEADDWPIGWMHDNIHKQMALAAYQVFCATHEVQEFAKTQEQ